MNVKYMTFLYSHYVAFGCFRSQVVAIMVMLCEDTEPGILYKDICISYVVQAYLEICPQHGVAGTAVSAVFCFT
jgi:hypothetical protein